MRACLRACMPARARACVRVCVCVCVSQSWGAFNCFSLFARGVDVKPTIHLNGVRSFDTCRGECVDLVKSLPEISTLVWSKPRDSKKVPCTSPFLLLRGTPFPVCLVGSLRNIVNPPEKDNWVNASPYSTSVNYENSPIDW